jgi:hypothetical protein
VEAHKAFVFYWKIEPAEGGWQAKQLMPEWKGEDFSKAFQSLWNRILDKPKAVSQL